MKCLTNPSRLLYSSLLLVFLLGSSQFSYGQTYCTPTYGGSGYGGCSDQDEISDVELIGENGTSISNPNSGCSGGVLGYGDFTSMTPVQLIQGSTYSISVSTDYPYGYEYEDVRLWIDYDNDGTFSDSEEIGSALWSGTYPPTGGFPASSGTLTFSFTVPATATVGTTRLRIRLGYMMTDIDPCTSITYGEAEDYTVSLLPLAPPNNAGVDSLVHPDSAGNFCSGIQPVKVRVSNLGKNALNSVNVDWSVDGVLQTGQSLTFNPPIDSISSPDHDTVITLGYANFPFQAGVDIKAWTSMPNGVPESDYTDDTLSLTVVSNMEGVVTDITPGDTAICAGSSVILDAGQQPEGCIFIWSNGAITQQTAVSQPGSYNVKVQSLQGCFAYDTVTITQKPQPVAGDFGIVDEGGNNFTFTPVNMENISLYHWDFGDGDTIDAGSAIPQPHHYTQTGTYAVSLTVSNDCGAITLSKQVYAQPATGIRDANNLAGVLKVYPNPVKDRLRISVQAANVQLQQVVIYNMLGKKVFVQKLQGNEAGLSLAQLPAGIYQARIQTTKGMANSRIEIIR